uniref:Uncharacterized protein n=1 Tax=Denticeps clupeoides TaxID=299321 RepID=A0AAY4C8G9_9TELE
MVQYFRHICSNLPSCPRCFHCPAPTQDTESWSHKNLSIVPHDLHPSLKKLDLSNNLIDHFISLNLTSLENLDMSFNHLQLIYKEAFKNLVQLHHLNLASNRLQNNIMNNSQAFKDLHSLRSLDISQNNLDEDAVKRYISHATSLERLTLRGNGVTRLTVDFFSSTKNLRALDLEDNLILDIEEGTFEPLERLDELNLAGNNLAHICDFKLHGVATLNLSRNSIEFFLTHESETTYHIQVLDLSYNSLIYFPIVPKKSHLRYLHLQQNKLGALGTENSASEAKSLYEEMTESKYLCDGDDNDNMFCYAKMMPLVYLDLSGNHLTSFPLGTASRLLSLETLNVSDNCLQNMSGQLGPPQRYSFPSLRHLDLKDNRIQQLTPRMSQAFPMIEAMTLRGNLVRLCAGNEPSGSVDQATLCVPFDQIGTLKHLDLQENDVTVVFPKTFAKTPLVSLNLAGNTGLVFESGALEDVQHTLEHLNVGQSNMTRSRLGFGCMRALRTLNVSDNNLDDLPNSLGCSRLSELDLRNNSLASLENLLTTNISLHLDILYISGNRFHCCNTAWVTGLKEANVTIPDLQQTRCLHQNDGTGSRYFLDERGPQCRAKAVNLAHVILIMLFALLVSLAAVACTLQIKCSNTSAIV